MAIKVLIRREFDPVKLREATALLYRARYAAMAMPGYIASETLSVVKNPSHIVVGSMWRSIEDWKRWAESRQRIEFTLEMQKIMKAPEKIEIYLLGIDFNP